MPSLSDALRACLPRRSASRYDALPDQENCLLCGSSPLDPAARALHHLRAATDALLAAHHPDAAMEVRTLAGRLAPRLSRD